MYIFFLSSTGLNSETGSKAESFCKTGQTCPDWIGSNFQTRFALWKIPLLSLMLFINDVADLHLPAAPFSMASSKRERWNFNGESPYFCANTVESLMLANEGRSLSPVYKPKGCLEGWNCRAPLFKESGAKTKEKLYPSFSLC